MYADHPISDSSDNQNAQPTRDELIEEYYPLVRAVVNGMLAHLPSCADADELHSVGVTGLVAAIDRYEPKHAKTFKSYAGTRIRGAILDELRRMDALPRTRRAKVRQLRQTVDKLEQTLGRAPNDSEIAKELKLSAKQYDRFRVNAETIHFVSLDQSHATKRDDEPNLHETIADERDEPVFQRLERNEMIGEVAELINQLPERQRSIIIQYYYEGKRLSDIAEVYGVTEARICQIHTQAVAKLRRSFQKVSAGATPSELAESI
ncbi:FliA/WhiG family RNA polymerase sigma factor [Cerasicoccus arenae]|uniref:RNA polymerase sigma factor FliA n=1 Tax=Cerasicoccus arenae TaxID=424488 RepID=A0A8J3GDB0_9BACT|nr:FliA/WhiG family RNA polymerase sigma factor [Cerasicoccus arenae]MBK1858616.1 FliA/WhiG family RNA polymerase sigma factor [Cerasicoccus arenae]GHC04972.1 RNA polymerase sigma factor FliA [Cerasicoccus arenae]